MFYKSARKEEEKRLKMSLNEYETLRQEVVQACERLFEQRQRAVDEVVEPVEDYLIRLAHSPEEFKRSVREFRIGIDLFKSTVRRSEGEYRRWRSEREDRRSERVAGAAGVAGAAAGV